MVTSGPSAKDLEAAAAFGLTAGDLVEPDVAVWPCCWMAVELFSAMGTQWRMGFSGPVGLDYAALPATMRYLGIPPAERRPLFDDLRVMEDAALNALAERTH